MKEKTVNKKYLYQSPINGKMVSRQRIYQIRNQGLKCIVCGCKNIVDNYHCENHKIQKLIYSRDFNRKTFGWKRKYNCKSRKYELKGEK